jgi:hypothetical protein
MTLKTYWLVDRTGSKALVEGAAERDRWVPHGWAEADEPTGDEMIWATYPDVTDPAQFPADAFREVWEPKGWVASAPPEPVDPITGIRPPRPVPTPPAAAPADTSKTKAATGGETEKTRG